MRDQATTNRLRIPCFTATAAVLLLACGACGAAGDPTSGPTLPSAPPGAAGPDGGASTVPSTGASTPPAPTCAVAPASGALEVATTRGLVKGVAAGNVSVFLGIPFASPPVGARRFAAPEPAACWTDVKTTTAFGAACPQAKTVGTGFDGAEDCLTLNVWTPSLKPAKNAPVLMFMYGGANVMGSSGESGIAGALYDGQALADAQKTVVVTFNYRVGALGFLAHPALSATSPKGVSGNYGLQDAILALHWVQDNIGSFGGDKSKVMFFGESAGAFNTCALVTSPLATGLFSSALMESGACDVPLMKDRYPRAQELAKTLKCDTATDTAACLRAAPIADVVSATGSLTDVVSSQTSGPIDVVHQNDLPFGSNVDGYVLPDTPLHTIAAGKANPVALVAGTNANEMNLFFPPGTVTSCLDYTSRLQTAYGTRAAEVEALYPCSLLNPTEAFSQLATDTTFACPSRRVLRALAKAKKAPLYRYHFEHTYAYGALSALGAFHVAEIPFVFGSFAGLGYVPTPAETALSATIQGYWARFAAAHDPNGAAQPLWETYDTTRDNALTLNQTIGSTDGVSTKACDYWDKLATP